MAKKVQKEESFHFPFTRMNYVLFFVSLIVIALGFYFQSIGPVNSFSSRTLAPIVLVIGFIIIMPIAIMWREKKS